MVQRSKIENDQRVNGNSLLPGETRNHVQKYVSLLATYVSYPSWFYLYESRMYREISLREPLKLVRVTGHDTAVRVSLCPQR